MTTTRPVMSRLRPAVVVTIVLGAFAMLASTSPVLNFAGTAIAILAPILWSLEWDPPRSEAELLAEDIEAEQWLNTVPQEEW